MCAWNRNRQSKRTRGETSGRFFAIWVLLFRFFFDLIHLRQCYNHFTACCSFENVVCVCVHWNSIWLSLKYHFTLFGVTVLLNDTNKTIRHIYSLALISGWYVLDSFYTVFSIHSSFLMYELCVYISYVFFKFSLAHSLTALFLFHMLDRYLWLAG